MAFKVKAEHSADAYHLQKARKDAGADPISGKSVRAVDRQVDAIVDLPTAIEMIRLLARRSLIQEQEIEALKKQLKKGT